MLGKLAVSGEQKSAVSELILQSKREGEILEWPVETPLGREEC